MNREELTAGIKYLNRKIETFNSDKLEDYLSIEVVRDACREFIRTLCKSALTPITLVTKDFIENRIRRISEFYLTYKCEIYTEENIERLSAIMVKALIAFIKETNLCIDEPLPKQIIVKNERAYRTVKSLIDFRYPVKFKYRYHFQYKDKSVEYIAKKELERETKEEEQHRKRMLQFAKKKTMKTVAV